jgi:hypothetical protein
MDTSEVGLASVATPDYPTLYRAVQDSVEAHNLTVEWLTDGPRGPVTWFNWMQIFRTPFGMSSAQRATKAYGGDSWEKIKQEQLQKHLEQIETSLLDGRLFRQITYHFDEEIGDLYPVETKCMGGARFYLRRDLKPEDTLRLSILRDCHYRDMTRPHIDGLEGEYLSEITLQVIPGA